MLWRGMAPGTAWRIPFVVRFHSEYKRYTLDYSPLKDKGEARSAAGIDERPIMRTSYHEE